MHGDSYHRDREAHGDHDNMMQDHEELSAEVAAQGHRLGLGPVIHLVTFDLKLVPVAQEHGIYIVHEVGHSKQDVGAGQPVPERKYFLNHMTLTFLKTCCTKQMFLCQRKMLHFSTREFKKLIWNFGKA